APAPRAPAKPPTALARRTPPAIVESKRVCWLPLPRHHNLAIKQICTDRENLPGKCYTMRMENGELLGYHRAGWYTASTSSRHHIFGKFKFCKSEACDGNESIDPS